MNGFAPGESFDRIVSVEMFQHMLNWRRLFGRVRSWLKPDGRFFMHVFTHNRAPYRFDHRDKEDWIAQHFFTGGVMPSHGFVREFADVLAVEQDLRWSSTHYSQTVRLWLRNFDGNTHAIRHILTDDYGNQAALWLRRWRLFFLATEGLFGHANGAVWCEPLPHEGGLIRATGQTGPSRRGTRRRKSSPTGRSRLLPKLCRLG